jgi:hypothetical protein
VFQVAYPTNAMDHADKPMSLRRRAIDMLVERIGHERAVRLAPRKRTCGK